MATPQVKTVRKTAPAARSNPIRKTAGKPKAAPAVLKLATTKAANEERTAPSAPKPASMTGPLPPIVTLKHLAEWAGYNHGVAKKQAIEMFTGFVADIGRVLKKGSKIRIPNLGVLQVRIRPARPARKGRNPATGEETRIKASKASKRLVVLVGQRKALAFAVKGTRKRRRWSKLREWLLQVIDHSVGARSRDPSLEFSRKWVES